MFRRFGVVAASALTGASLMHFYSIEDARAHAYIGITQANTPVFDDHFPRKPWNFNWDLRDPLALCDPIALERADPETRKAMVEAKTSSAVRNIFLIRHGQYELNGKEPSDKKLTPLGREQAELCGKRLATIPNQKHDRIIVSTMVRAMETANIISQNLPGLPFTTDSLLEEGAPYPTEPPHSIWRPSKKSFYMDNPRIEAAFRKYIHRADVSQKEDSYELIVCHANVIRYFIMRVMQLPPEAWLRMSLANTSITWLQIRPNGTVYVKSIGDHGHCHPASISYS